MKNNLFTIIRHNIRRQLKLSLEEYVLLDAIYHLSNKGINWCHASREYFSLHIGVTPRTVTRYIGRLLREGIIERNKRNQIRPSEYVCKIFMDEKAGKNVTKKLTNDPHGMDNVSSYQDNLSSNNNSNNDKEIIYLINYLKTFFPNSFNRDSVEIRSLQELLKSSDVRRIITIIEDNAEEILSSQLDSNIQIFTCEIMLFSEHSGGYITGSHLFIICPEIRFKNQLQDSVN